MARYTIGRILPIFQGSWDSTQTYDKLDIVLKDTISFVSLIDDNNTTPSESNTNWQVVARGATAEEVVEVIEGGQLQLGRLDVDDDIQAGAVYVNGVPVATTNDIRYGIDEISIDQTGTDRVNIETTMIGGGGSSQSILAATSTRAGVMSATDKAKLDSISPQGDHPVEVEADGNGDLDVSDDAGYVIGRFENGHIRTKNFYSGNIYTKSEVDNLIGSGGITQQQLNTALATKQDKLTSGTNIKTVNGNSLLGSGDIETNTPLHLKLVVIGNSYSADSFMYLPFILLNYGITIELGVYHRGGASLQNQVDEWTTGNGSASFWFINTKIHTSWQTISSNYSPKQAIDYNTWDIITIQQGSIASVDYANYTTAARSLINLITDEVSYPYTLAWNININRDSSGSDYTAIANQILTNINNICQREPVNLIFPYGTAIFDARTNSTLNAIGAGGSLYASDKVHLQEGLPCYIAAITNVQTLFNRYYPTLSVLNDSVGATITQSVIDGWGVKGQQGTCTGISASNCRLAQICAVLANRFNFEIKTIY